LDRDSEKRESTAFIEKMMLSNKMAVIATFTDSGHQQCHDCGYGHDCVVGNVYANMGLTTAENAKKNHPVEYGDEAQKEAKAIGKMLGSILNARI
jgi:hypothetical protein